MRYQVTLVDLQEQPAAVVHGHVGTDEIGPFLGSAFGEIMSVVEHEGLHHAGAPFGRYLPTEDGGFDVEAGFPVRGEVVPEGRVEAASLPGGTVARTLYVGAYDGVAEAYKATSDWILENGYIPAGAPWECYLDDPEVPEPRTEVFMPCQPVHPVHA